MTKLNSNKILILGSSTKSGITTAREFKKEGYEITVVDWKNLPSKHSKYIKRYIDLGSPEKDMDSFGKLFLDHLQKENYKCVLPLHDISLEVCYRFRKEISAHTFILGMNDPEIYKYAQNKWELLNLAKEQGIPIPNSIYIDTLETLHKNLDKIVYPCVLKPVSSARLQDNKIIHFSVSFIQTKEVLIDKVRELINNTPVMIQETISGFGIGYNLIAKDGEILNGYIHKRINEHGGVSSYREVLPVETFNLKPQVEKLIKAINWTGVAMVEFKVQNGIPVLMEMNGRFYGSIELAIKCGLNYPMQLLEMQMNDKVPAKNIPIRAHVRVRNLHEEVLLNYASLFKGHIGQFIKWKFSVLRTRFSPKEYIEDRWLRDPGFVFALYWADVKRIAKKIRKKIKLKFSSLPKRKLELKNSGTSLNIGFICKGNICRSPFAELYARAKNTSHQFHSFGTYPIDHRLSPANAVKAGSKFKIDLHTFNSSILTLEKAKAMDVLVVMDKQNYLDLVEMGIPRDKIRSLCTEEVKDPYGQNLEYFEYVYSQISKAIDAL